jgi:nucleoside-diphosphate-sugar epimerase
MLDSEKILITGATGKIAFPIARALAQRNEVWGAARLREQADRGRLGDAGITPIAFDMSTGDFPALPDDFTYVFHAAVDSGADDVP